MDSPILSGSHIFNLESDGGNQASQTKDPLSFNFGSPPTIAFESDASLPRCPPTIADASPPEPFLTSAQLLIPSMCIEEYHKKQRLHRSRTTPALVNIELETISSPAASFPRRRSDLFDYKKIAIILSIYLGAGTVCFYLLRHQMSGRKTNGILDALYYTVVSMTSVGYGDLSPDGTGAILLASVFSLMGILLIGLVLSKASDFLVQKHDLLWKDLFKTKEIPTPKPKAKAMGSSRVRNLCVILVVVFVVLMAVGTVVLVSVEDLDYIHAFYCINAAITGVGSDQCFSTKRGRVFGIFWIFSGSVYLGLVIFTFTEQQTQRRQEAIQNWALQDKITVADFLAADIDNEGFLRRSAYVLFKLKQIGKISQEDIVPFLQEFDQSLDVNGNGMLTLKDLL